MAHSEWELQLAQLQKDRPILLAQPLSQASLVLQLLVVSLVPLQVLALQQLQECRLVLAELRLEQTQQRRAS